MQLILLWFVVIICYDDLQWHFVVKFCHVNLFSHFLWLVSSSVWWYFVLETKNKPQCPKKKLFKFVISKKIFIYLWDIFAICMPRKTSKVSDPSLWKTPRPNRYVYLQSIAVDKFVWYGTAATILRGHCSLLV